MQDVHRLLGELREVGETSLAWRQHASAELCRLTGAVVGMSIEAYEWGAGRAPQVVAVVDVGWRGDAERQLFHDFRGDPRAGGRDACIAALARHARRDHVVAREQIVPDAEWYAGPATAEGRLPAGIDHFLLSSRVISRGGVACGTDQLVIHRPPGARPFLDRHRRMLALLHDELARLWRRPPAPVGGLPEHLRRTLSRLQAGRSEKEAARDLGLSVHTVHSYAGELHRRLGVASRAELLSRFGARYDFTPRLNGPGVAP